MIAELAAHEPLLVYFDTDRITTPAEVCGTCSDEESGHWVPVTSCPTAAANQLPEGALNPHVLTLEPKCPACGRRTQMRWTSARSDAWGWLCGHDDCRTWTPEGEDE